MRNMKRQILQLLRNRNEGCDEQEIRRRLRPTSGLTFDEEVAHQTDIDRALQTLKQEHRAWPTDRINGRHWAITTKGILS